MPHKLLVWHPELAQWVRVGPKLYDVGHARAMLASYAGQHPQLAWRLEDKNGLVALDGAKHATLTLRGKR